MDQIELLIFFLLFNQLGYFSISSSLILIISLILLTFSIFELLFIYKLIDRHINK